MMYDSKRDPFNNEKKLLPNENAENSTSTAFNIDILSNGFKVRTTHTAYNNANGETYIYMAFAENQS